MKKLVLSLVATGGMFFATQGLQAQETGEANATQAQEQAAQQQDDFEKIEIAELPQAVQEAVATQYEGATTEEAWVKEKDGAKKYKLQLNHNGQTTKIYAHEDGTLKAAKEEAKQESEK